MDISQPWMGGARQFPLQGKARANFLAQFPKAIPECFNTNFGICGFAQASLSPFLTICVPPGSHTLPQVLSTLGLCRALLGFPAPRRTDTGVRLSSPSTPKIWAYHQLGC